jgi:hypothetical protein
VYARKVPGIFDRIQPNLEFLDRLLSRNKLALCWNRVLVRLLCLNLTQIVQGKVVLLSIVVNKSNKMQQFNRKHDTEQQDSDYLQLHNDRTTLLLTNL